MTDAKFIDWLRANARKADDAAHDMELGQDQRNLAWGRAEAYYAVLAKLGHGATE